MALHNSAACSTGTCNNSSSGPVWTLSFVMHKTFCVREMGIICWHLLALQLAVTGEIKQGCFYHVATAFIVGTPGL